MYLPDNSGKKPCIFLVGGTGAGKTELALNLSRYLAKHYGACTLLDLDIVNPFFRVRQFLSQFAEQGVKIVCPEEKYMFGDVPSLQGSAWAAVENPDEVVVCDVGGGEPGLRLLGRMREVADARGAMVHFLLNPFRPDFLDQKTIEDEYRHTCELCSLQVSSIIANPNLSEHTTVDDYKEGLGIVQGLAKRVQVEVAYSMATEKLAKELGANPGDIPGFTELDGKKLFVPERYWSVPWQFGVAS